MKSDWIECEVKTCQLTGKKYDAFRKVKCKLSKWIRRAIPIY